MKEKKMQEADFEEAVSAEETSVEEMHTEQTPEEEYLAEETPEGEDFAEETPEEALVEEMPEGELPEEAGMEESEESKEKKPVNKKKIIIIICVVLGVLLVVAAVLAFIFMRQKSESIELFQSQIESSWDAQESAQEKPEFMKLLESKASFEVTDFTDDGDGHFAVTVKVTSPDLLPAMNKLNKSVKKELSQEELDKLFTKAVNQAQPKESSLSLGVQKEDDVYQVEFSDEFIDAMYGYAFSYANSQLNEATKIK